MTHGMYVPQNYGAGILTFGLRDVAFDMGPLTLMEPASFWVSHEPGGGFILAPPSISALRHLRNWC